MWVYFPASMCPSSPASEDSTLDCAWHAPASTACCTWNGKPTPWKSLLAACRKAGLTKLLSGLTSAPSTLQRCEGAWKEWLGDFPAHPSAWPGNDRPRKTSGGSGQRSSVPFARLGPDGLFLRMSQDSYLPGMEPPSETYSETWPKSGSMRNGYVSRRRSWVPRIDANEFSFWPTVQTTDTTAGRGVWETDGGSVRRPGGDAGTARGANLSDMAEMWPTPRAEDAESCGNHPNAVDSLTGLAGLWHTPHGIANTDKTGKRAGPSGNELGRQAGLWITPMTPNGGRIATRKGDRDGEDRHLENQTATWMTPNPNDHKGSTAPGQRRRQLSEQTEACQSSPQPETTTTGGNESLPLTRTLRRRLNPAFVCWLMGLPWWWTRTEAINCEREEMESYLSRQRLLLWSLCGES